MCNLFAHFVLVCFDMSFTSVATDARSSKHSNHACPNLEVQGRMDVLFRGLVSVLQVVRLAMQSNFTPFRKHKICKYKRRFGPVLNLVKFFFYVVCDVYSFSCMLLKIAQARLCGSPHHTITSFSRCFCRTHYSCATGLPHIPEGPSTGPN